MNQVLLEVLEGRLDRVAGRVTLLGGFLMLAAGMVVGIAMWNLSLTRELDRVREENTGMQSALDSLQTARRAMVLTGAQGAERLDGLERRVGRFSNGVRHAELIAVRGWISRLERRIVSHEERLATFEGRLDESFRAAEDSIAASDARLEASVGVRFAAAERARSGLVERHAVLERRVDGMEQRDRNRLWRRAVSLGLGAMGVGVVVPHVLGHGGR